MGPSIKNVRTYGKGGGGVKVSYTIPLRITCKKGRIACKIAHILNGRPLSAIFSSLNQGPIQRDKQLE